MLVKKFREHKIVTQNSFSRVKSKHYVYDRKINELQARIKELESLLEILETPKIYTKKKKKR